MGNYDSIQVPISGQPISKSQWGDRVRAAIVDLDTRVSKIEFTIPNEGISVGALTSGTNATLTLADLPGGNGWCGFTKKYGSAYTNLMVDISISASMTVGTVPSAGKLGCRIGADSRWIDNKVFQVLGQHHAMRGAAIYSGLAAGPYQVFGQIAPVSSTHTMAVDFQDWACITVREIPI